MINKKELSPVKTVLTIVIGFLIIYVIIKSTIVLWIAVSIGVLGLLSSFLALKIQDIWLGLSKILSGIIPPILLSIIFYVILFPVALLSRFFEQKDPLQLKQTNKHLFKKVNKTFSKESFEKTW